MDYIENNEEYFLAKVVIELPEKQGLSTKAQVWENLYLVRAENLASAYAKAIRIGEGDCVGPVPLEDGSEGYWALVGVSELIPVYEDICDGCELMWTDHAKIKRSEALAMVRPLEFWLEKR